MAKELNEGKSILRVRVSVGTVQYIIKKASLQVNLSENAMGRTAMVLVEQDADAHTLWSNGYFGTLVDSAGTLVDHR